MVTFELDLELHFAVQLHIYYRNHGKAVDYRSFQCPFANFHNVMHTIMNIKDLHAPIEISSSNIY